MTPKGEDLKLQYPFAIKLRKTLQSEIISREFTYNSLQEVIQVAEWYEKIHPRQFRDGNLTHWFLIPQLIQNHHMETRPFISTLPILSKN